MTCRWDTTAAQNNGTGHVDQHKRRVSLLLGRGGGPGVIEDDGVGGVAAEPSLKGVLDHRIGLGRDFGEPELLSDERDPGKATHLQKQHCAREQLVGIGRELQKIL